MSSDHKPKGKIRQSIEASNRMAGRQEIRKELHEMANAPNIEHNLSISAEIDEALYDIYCNPHYEEPVAATMEQIGELITKWSKK